MSVEALADDVAGAHRRERVDPPLLWHVADVLGAASGRAARHADPAGAEALESENGANEAGLARAVGAEHRDELARLDPQRQVGPQPPRPEAQPRVLELQHRRGHQPSAVLMASRFPLIQVR